MRNHRDLQRFIETHEAVSCCTGCGEKQPATEWETTGNCRKCGGTKRKYAYWPPEHVDTIRNNEEREETMMQNPVRQEIASTLKASRAVEREYGLHQTIRDRNEDARYAATVELHRNGIQWGTHDPHGMCPTEERAFARKNK